MLIKPSNSAGAHCQNMKLNIDDIVPLKTDYLCENETCRIENRNCLSYYRNQKCICGKLLNREKSRKLRKEIGLVNETSTFIVSDDLYVMPNVVITSLNLLQKHGVNDIDAIDKQALNINISKKEVVDLLKLSLVSKLLCPTLYLKSNNLLKL
ncbi:hypothetical protein MtrunA17_Chr7g0241191 [Medicago truncatula]|uniref:DUF674 family protein n=1 Tax=Medicago truncatula TaxID=3880 RepID=A0A396GZA1_MEDTR|nr:hypothetical protein MtrunA17_Chr7g0241191 [Medicago truncatula]